MKNILFLFVFIGSSLLANAQEDVTCYQKYAKVFEVRGANEVKDGAHKSVIITVRKGSFADCFMGTVNVKNGTVDVNSIQLSFIDNSTERFNRTYKYEDPITITNGMSRTMVTRDDELVNVLFIEEIKPKKKEYMRAPDPEFDF